MKKLFALFALWFAVATPAAAQTGGVATATTSIAIAISSATTTLLVTNTNANRQIWVTAADVISSGTGNIQFVYGTGATCGTGQTNVTGNYPLTAQVGFTKGSGFGAVWIIPAGKSLCVVTDASVTYAGSLAYAMF